MGTQSIDLKSLTKPLNSNSSPAEAITERFNAVFGGKWTFRIIEHQVRDTEVIVLGELGADGAIRQRFGKAIISFDTDPSGAPSLADHLTKAADDALVQCARAFGVRPESNSQETAEPEPDEDEEQPPKEAPAKSNGKGDRPLTNRQLAAIFGLGKANNLTQQEIIDLTTERFGSEPSELTVSQASTIIGQLSADTGKE